MVDVLPTYTSKTSRTASESKNLDLSLGSFMPAAIVSMMAAACVICADRILTEKSAGVRSITKDGNVERKSRVRLAIKL